MADIVVVRGLQLEPQNAPFAARPGSIELQNILGVAKLVDDQGVATTIAAGGVIVRAFETAEIDLTVSPQSGIVLVPAMAGYHFIRQSINWKITAQTGTATGPPTLKAGNNATFDNMIISQSNPTAAIMNAAAAVVPYLAFLNGSAQGVGSPLIDMATPATVSVTAAATGTGGFTLKGKVEISGWLVPV